MRDFANKCHVHAWLVNPTVRIIAGNSEKYSRFVDEFFAVRRAEKGRERGWDGAGVRGSIARERGIGSLQPDVRDGNHA